jgi:hypothetical protein
MPIFSMETRTITMAMRACGMSPWGTPGYMAYKYLAVARVARPLGLGLPRRVAQVVAHLGAQRALQQRLLELIH